MGKLIAIPVRLVIAVLQALPLGAVARLGRFGGWLAWLLDRRHRRVALQNLTAAFGTEKSTAEIRAIARENFLRLGENYACAVKTAGMPDAEIAKILEIPDLGGMAGLRQEEGCVGAIGHFGNFELYARTRLFLPGRQLATTFRGLPQPELNKLLLSLRRQSGALFFDRRTDAGELKAAMRQGGVILGLLADQHAGNRGLRLPFLGRECSSSAAPALFALRYDCPLIVAICFRTAPGRWRIEVSERIPTHENGAARSVESITRDVNTAFEKAIRRDPANWFWVHNRWKPVRLKTPAAAPAPEPAEVEEGL